MPRPEIERLRKVGHWLAVNGEAIYGTSATLFGDEVGSFSATEVDQDGKPKFTPAWKWRSTTSANRIYIELLSWPKNQFHLETIPRHVSGAFLLADKAEHPLQITKTATGIDIALPRSAPDPLASVLVLTTD